jgi:hypothetical protein
VAWHEVRLGCALCLGRHIYAALALFDAFAGCALGPAGALEPTGVSHFASPNRAATCAVIEHNSLLEGAASFREATVSSPDLG